MIHPISYIKYIGFIALALTGVLEAKIEPIVAGKEFTLKGSKTSTLQDLKDNINCTGSEARKKDSGGMPSKKSLQCASNVRTMMLHRNFADAFYNTHCEKKDKNTHVASSKKLSAKNKKLVNEVCQNAGDSITKRKAAAKKDNIEAIKKAKREEGYDELEDQEDDSDSIKDKKSLKMKKKSSKDDDNDDENGDENDDDYDDE